MVVIVDGGSESVTAPRRARVKVIVNVGETQSRRRQWRFGWGEERARSMAPSHQLARHHSFRRRAEA